MDVWVHFIRDTSLKDWRWKMRRLLPKWRTSGKYLTGFSLKSYLESQNYRIAGAGRHLWKSAPRGVSWSRLLRPLSMGLHGWSLHSLGNLMRYFNTPMPKFFILIYFLSLNRISCISVCAHCLLSCHWIPLRRVQLSLLFLTSSLHMLMCASLEVQICTNL